MAEARVKQLEGGRREVGSDLKALRSDVAKLKGKVSVPPGWGGRPLSAGLVVTVVGLMIRVLPAAGQEPAPVLSPESRAPVLCAVCCAPAPSTAPLTPPAAPSSSRRGTRTPSATGRSTGWPPR